MGYTCGMDVVYILGSGSLAGNAEIRYSLRSLERNMGDLGKVYVVGESPGFLRDCERVPANDDASDKWKNAYEKTLKACGLPDLTDDFLLMNDDFFFTEPFLGAEWPYFALAGSNGGSCGMHSFHIHAAIRLNKEMYIKMPFSIEQKACRSPRSFYGNFYKVKPRFCGDFVLRAARVCRDFDEQIKDWECFSVSDSAMLDESFREWLENKYPVPSSFEV